MKTLTRIVSTAALATALAVAGCNRSPDAGSGNTQAIALPMLPATLPLDVGESNPISFAPSASDLPDAPELKFARVADSNQAYGYANAAFSYDEAIGDAPPDYAFDYDDVDPWAWQGYDNSVMIAEPIDDGYRYYYYRPGAEQPYFVRDPWYSYGYSDGLLAAVYAADGGIVSYGDYGPRAIYASRYYVRGRQLWGASRQGRRPVVASAWLRRGPVIAASLARWGEGRSRQPAWRAFAASEGPRQARYWQAERTRRDADSRRFADWRQSGFRTAPPPRAIPAAWQAASWAKDQKRYRPAAATEQRGEQRGERGNGRGDRLDDRQDARGDRRDDREQGVARQDRRDEAQAARAERRDDRQPQLGGRRDRQDDRGGRGEGREANRQGDQRPPRDRGEPVQQRDRVERQQAQAERRAERTEGQPGDRAGRRENRRPDRQQFERPDRPERQQAERQDRAQGERPERQRPDRQQPDRQRPDRGQRQQQDDGERMQRQQPAQARQQAEQGQRQQAMQAQRQAAQAQQRQAEQAQRQQAMQAQRQAEQAQRQQAAQAQRQQQQQAQRQQQQQQRQDQRQERRENRRGPN